MKRSTRVFMTVICLALLVSGIIFTVLAGLWLSEPEPQVPPDVPTSMGAFLSQSANNTSIAKGGTPAAGFEPPHLIGDGQIPVSQGQTFYIIPYDRGVNITIYFSDVTAYRAQMEGRDAKLKVLLPNKYAFNASTVDDSLSFPNWVVPSSEKEVPAIPWISLPLTLNEQQNHTWITAKAEANISYYKLVIPPPTINNGKNRALQEHTEHLTRDLVFFVVSPAEYQMLQRHNDWAAISFGFGLPKTDRSVVILAYSACAFAGIAASGTILYYTFRRR